MVLLLYRIFIASSLIITSLSLSLVFPSSLGSICFFFGVSAERTELNRTDGIYTFSPIPCANNTVTNPCALCDMNRFVIMKNKFRVPPSCKYGENESYYGIYIFNFILSIL